MGELAHDVMTSGAGKAELQGLASFKLLGDFYSNVVGTNANGNGYVYLDLTTSDALQNYDILFCGGTFTITAGSSNQLYINDASLGGGALLKGNLISQAFCKISGTKYWNIQITNGPSQSTISGNQLSVSFRCTNTSASGLFTGRVYGLKLNP